MENSIKTLTLWTTNKCNMRCSYCYVRKNDVTMSFDIARKAIDHIFKQTSFNGNTFNLQFFGGEPLLALDLIKESVDYSHYICKKQNKKAAFSFTTNGTLLNDDNLSYFRDNRFNIMISLDGPEKVHDCHRVLSKGQPSYKSVLEGMQLTRQYLGQMDIRMTIHPDEPDIADNVFYIIKLMKEIGKSSTFAKKTNGKRRFYNGSALRDLIVGPVEQADWLTQVNNGKLLSEFKKLSDLIITEIRSGQIPHISTFFTIFSHYLVSMNPKRQETSEEMATTKVSCLNCLSEITVTPDGHLFPCKHFFDNPDLAIGHVESGINWQNIEESTKLDIETYHNCIACEAKPVCGLPCFSSILSQEKHFKNQSATACIFFKHWLKSVKYVYSLLSLESIEFEKICSIGRS